MSNKLSIAAMAVSVVSLGLSCVILFTGLNAKKESTSSEDKSTSSVVTAAAEEDLSEQYVMYIGTNDKDTYKQEIPTDEAKKIVDEICLSHFDGYTIQEASGAWKDETDTITHEYTIVCYFDGADSETVHKVADEVIEKLNQNTVLIEKDDINMEFYGGAE